MRFREEYNMDLFMETTITFGDSCQLLFRKAAEMLYTDYLNFKNNIAKKSIISDGGTDNSNTLKVEENNNSSVRISIKKNIGNPINKDERNQQKSCGCS
jgi:hypothetical protein